MMVPATIAVACGRPITRRNLELSPVIDFYCHSERSEKSVENNIAQQYLKLIHSSTPLLIYLYTQPPSKQEKHHAHTVLGYVYAGCYLE